LRNVVVSDRHICGGIAGLIIDGIEDVDRLEEWAMGIVVRHAIVTTALLIEFRIG
jgi:hypothetical protein